MCEPTTLAMVGSMALSAAQGYSQHQAAQEQADYQNSLAIQTAQNAKASMFDQSQQSALRFIQEEESSLQKQMQNRMEGQKARATARVSAGESGVAGLSVDALQADFHRQEILNRETIGTNLDYAQQQTGMDLKAIQAQAASRRNVAARNMVSGPSKFGTALKIGSGVFNSYQTYKT